MFGVLLDLGGVVIRDYTPGTCLGADAYKEKQFLNGYELVLEMTTDKARAEQLKEVLVTHGLCQPLLGELKTYHRSGKPWQKPGDWPEKVKAMIAKAEALL